MLAEILLPLWIERWISSVVIKQRHLNLSISRAIKEELIHVTGVRADRFRIASAVGVLPLRSFQGEKFSKLFSILRTRILPVCLHRFRKLPQPLLVGIPVLHNQGLHSLWVFSSNSIANGRTIIHHIKTVFLE